MQTQYRESYFITLAMLVVCSAMVHPSFRYIAYAAPIIIVFEVLLARQISIRSLYLAAPLICIVFFNTLSIITSELTLRLLQEQVIFIFIILTCLAYGTASFKLTIFIATFFFLLIVSTYGISNFEFNFLSSSSSLENGLSFVFGLLAITAFIKKKWLIFIFLSLMLIVSLKRIAILGALLSITYLLFNNRLKSMVTASPFIISANLLIIAVLFVFTSGGFDEFISEITGGMTSNQFTMGRFNMYSIITNDIFNNYERFVFWGKGLGSGSQLIEDSILIKMAMHSDLLKIIYETGFLCLILFLHFLYLPFRKVKNLDFFALPIYFNILLVTDNVLIYQYFWLFYVACAGLLFHEREQKSIYSN